jgi:lambda family phage tail tape measure protein
MAKFESTVQFAVNAQTKNVAVLDDFRKRVDGIGKSAQQSTGGIGALTTGLAGMSRGLATLGIGVSVAGLLGLGKSAVDLAGKLNDAAVATTVAATRLDQYRQAGEQVGVSFETITGGLGKLNKTIAAAASGNQEAANAFKDLGIAVTNNDGSIRATSDIFEELAQKIRAAPDNAAIFEQGTKIMGRGFASLLPLLEEGDEGMRKFQSRFSEEGIKNLDDFGDKLNRLGEAFKGMAASVTEVTVSGLLESVEFLNNTIGYTLRNAGLLEQQRQKMNYTPTFGKAPINNPQMSTVSGLMSPIPGGDAEARFKDLASKKAAQAQRSYAAERQSQIAEEARALKQLAQEQAREAERQKSILSDFSSQNQSRLDDLQLELQLMGKSRKEQEKILFLREIDNEARRLGLDLTDENIAKLEKEAEAAKKKVKVVLDEIEKNKGSFSAGVGEGITKYLDDVNNLSLQASNLVMNTFQGAEDALIDLTTKGKLSFRDLADSIIADIARIAIRQSITGPLAGLLGGMFQPSGGAVGGFYGNFAQQNIGKAMSPSGFVNVTPNALGGIMTSDGSMPLNRYSMGGIANRPQLALFGEGRTPEAFVPLPDGRRIPVAMQGGGNTSVVVHVNVESGSQNVTSSGQNAEALGKTIAAAVRSTLISEKRPGGLLS